MANGIFMTACFDGVYLELLMMLFTRRARLAGLIRAPVDLTFSAYYRDAANRKHDDAAE